MARQLEGEQLATKVSPVTAYARRVVTGKVPAGKYHKLCCERHLKDLARSRTAKFAFKFDTEKADFALSFFPELQHYKGKRWQGQKFKLTDWQVFCIGSIFGWVEKGSGLRRFDRAFIEVPKKNGKTFMAAAIGIKQAFFDNEPGAEVYSIATMRDQAARLWADAQQMVKASPHLSSRITHFRGVKVLNRDEHAQKFQPLSKDSNSADGVNPHCVLADELHRHKDDQLINVMTDSMVGRDEPLMIETTTAGVGRETVGWAHHKYCVDIIEGIQKNESRFVFIAGADPEDREKFQDEKVWKKANPNWGISVNPRQVRKNCSEAIGMPSKLNDFLRYHMNIWVEQFVRWLPMEKWDACPVGERDLIGATCFGGLDLAKTRDIAAYILLFPDVDDFIDLRAWFWMPKDGLKKKAKEDKVRYDVWADQGLIELTDGNVIDQDVIKARILETGKQYDIRQIGIDPWNSTKLALELQEQTPPDTIIDVPQTWPNLAEPTKHLETLVGRLKVRHGNNPVLRWMAANSSVKTNEDGYIKIDKKHSASQKIDGIVATIIAMGRFIDNVKPPPPSKYDSIEERPDGLLSF